MLTDIHFVHPFSVPIDQVQGCRKLEAISHCTKIHLVLIDRAVYGTTEFLKANYPWLPVFPEGGQELIKLW